MAGARVMARAGISKQALCRPEARRLGGGGAKSLGSGDVGVYRRRSGGGRAERLRRKGAKAWKSDEESKQQSEVPGGGTL